MDSLLKALDEGLPLPQSVSFREKLREYFWDSWRFSNQASIFVDKALASRPIPRREYGAPPFWQGGVLMAGGVRYGDERSFNLAPAEMNAADFCGYYHTHPSTSAYFSDADFLAILRSQPLRILCAHHKVFLSILVRSGDADPSLDARQVKADWDVFDSSNKNTEYPINYCQTNKAMCGRYGLTFYYGELWGKLKKVDL
jgi:proteasome lid subunit RPN8/RPN11